MSGHAERMRQELLALRDDSGLLNPRHGVIWARDNPGSALHGSLEWDNDVAGEAYRVEQMRGLIQIHLVSVGGERSFVSLSIDRRTGGYRSIEDIAQRVDLRAIMLADALGELERVRHKYEIVQGLERVWAEVALVPKRIENAKAISEARARNRNRKESRPSA